MTNLTKKPSHYYGDTVRFLFLIAGVIMLLMLPTVAQVLNIPIIVSVVAILALGLAAGFTNPKQKLDALINVFISAAGFLIFESTAVWTYQRGITTDRLQFFFIASITLGLIFLLALYFSVKTFRAEIVTPE